jgi:2-oxoisovalerate dehydrogenase E1 component
VKENHDRLDAEFIQAVGTMTEVEPRDPGLPVRAGSGLTGLTCLDLFEDQAASRHLDFAARWLRARGAGFYTIGSSGHESNAAVAAALRPTDPALLHYRSGAFYVARGRQVSGHDPILDVLLGLIGSTDEPIAGGRHKVFGHHALAVIPQTSTIGSHLPRAVGTAFAIEKARKLGVPSPWPSDALVVCSFGDASANHSTALGAINAACWASYQGLPMPLLLVCEDNGIGISVRTPPGWVNASYRNRPGLRYAGADGSDSAEVFDVAQAAADWVRQRRRPAFVHLSTVRLSGHAGSDVESAYRTSGEIAADYGRDPLLGTARLLVEAGAATPLRVLERYEAVRERVMGTAGRVSDQPSRFFNAAQVIRPLAQHRPDVVRTASASAAPLEARRAVFAGVLPEDEGPLTLALSPAKEVSTASPGACNVASGQHESSTRSSTSKRSLDSPLAPESPVCFRLPRSNTWLTFTTPKTRSAARRQPCPFSPKVSFEIRWSSGSLVTRTKRASVAIFTTTTPLPSCATSPAWSSRRQREPTTLPQ